MKFKGMAILIAASIGLGACAKRSMTAKTKDGRAIDLLPSAPNSIINGHEVTELDDFSKTIAGVYNLEDKTLCTGSILAENLVLTAAHCIPKNPKNLRVFFGFSMENIISTHRALQVLLSPAYGERFHKLADWGDIAIVKFSGRIPESYKAVDLYEEPRSLDPGERTLIAGYGVNNGLSGDGSGVLRKTYVTIEDPHFGDFEMSINQTNGSGACHGDSGGPAYVITPQGLKLWGITSRSLRDSADDCSHFSIYSNVQAYHDWIVQAQFNLTQTASAVAVH